MVSRLTELMEKELKANQHKGDFSLWSPDTLTLLNEIAYHVDKLATAMFEEDSEATIEYAADVANYMAKVVQLEEEYKNAKDFCYR